MQPEHLWLCYKLRIEQNVMYGGRQTVCVGGASRLVIDGQTPLGVETDRDLAERHELLHAIGYKL